jgi:hypothetical protein
MVAALSGKFAAHDRGSRRSGGLKPAGGKNHASWSTRVPCPGGSGGGGGGLALASPPSAPAVAFVVLGALVSTGLIGAAEAGAATLEMLMRRNPANLPKLAAEQANVV